MTNDIKENGYHYAGYDRGLEGHILYDRELRKFELWRANKGAACFTLKFGNTDLEFCCTLGGAYSHITLPGGDGLPVREDVKEVEYHREPTPSEIRFGHGATHYRTFPVLEATHPNHTLRKWIKADDGLRYYR